MKPVVIIGPGVSLLNCIMEPVSGRVLLICPVCGAAARVDGTRGGPVNVPLCHQPDCELFAKLEQLGGNGKDGTNGSVH